MVALIASLFVGYVFALSVFSKLVYYSEHQTWVRNNWGATQQRMLSLVIPAELIGLGVLVSGSYGGPGAELALALALLGLSSTVVYRLAASKRCACFGALSLRGELSPLMLFAVAAALSGFALLMQSLVGDSPDIGSDAISVGWMSSLILAFLRVAWTYVPAESAQHNSGKKVVVAGFRALDEDVRQVYAIMSRTEGAPLLILFMTEHCTACHDMKAPVSRFLELFKHSADAYYCLDENVTVPSFMADEVGGSVPLGANELRRVFGIEVFPSAALVIGGEIPAARVYDTPSGIRAALSNFIR